MKHANDPLDVLDFAAEHPEFVRGELPDKDTIFGLMQDDGLTVVRDSNTFDLRGFCLSELRDGNLTILASGDTDNFPYTQGHLFDRSIAARAYYLTNFVPSPKTIYFVADDVTIQGTGGYFDTHVPDEVSDAEADRYFAKLCEDIEEDRGTLLTMRPRTAELILFRKGNMTDLSDFWQQWCENNAGFGCRMGNTTLAALEYLNGDLITTQKHTES